MATRSMTLLASQTKLNMNRKNLGFWKEWLGSDPNHKIGTTNQNRLRSDPSNSANRNATFVCALSQNTWHYVTAPQRKLTYILAFWMPNCWGPFLTSPLAPGDNFAPRGELCPQGWSSPLRSPAGVNTLYCLEEWRGEQRISSPLHP
jgi:hypothetical protein